MLLCFVRWGRDMQHNNLWRSIVSTQILPCICFLNMPSHVLSLALARNACPLVQARNNQSTPWNRKQRLGKQTSESERQNVHSGQTRTFRTRMPNVSGPQKGPSGKGSRQKTSKIGKKCQKYFRHFSTFFAQGKKVKTGGSATEGFSRDPRKIKTSADRDFQNTLFMRAICVTQFRSRFWRGRLGMSHLDTAELHSPRPHLQWDWQQDPPLASRNWGGCSSRPGL